MSGSKNLKTVIFRWNEGWNSEGHDIKIKGETQKQNECFNTTHKFKLKRTAGKEKEKVNETTKFVMEPDPHPSEWSVELVENFKIDKVEETIIKAYAT